MKLSLSICALVLLLAGCGDNSNNSSPAPTPANSSADYAGALGRGQAKALTTVDLASLKQAIQMFNVNEGRYPKDLKELVDAQLIIRIPETPHGMKLAYDAASGTVSMVPE